MTQGSTTHSDLRGRTHKVGLLAGASLALVASPVLAQSQPQSPVEPAPAASDGTDIVVSGIRFSMETAAGIKRADVGVIEAVVAEDIGKLPDMSVAESLARLPGVAAQRVDGRAQEISIRGMGPGFAVTLLNGNEVVSSGDGRSFQYDQLPAELVNTMVVYKTSEVSLSSQGLAGTVDIRTVHPLDVGKRRIALNARAEANSYGKLVPGISSHGERLSATYIDQFADGKLGIALGYSRLGSPEEKKYFNPWDFGRSADLGVVDAAGNTLAGNPLTVDGFETGNQSTKTARDSFLGVLEFKSGGFHSIVNYLHSSFGQHMRGDEIVGVMANWSPATAPGVALVSGGTAGDIVQNVTNASMLLTFRGNDRSDRMDAVDWNSELEMGQWLLRGDVSYSRARRHETTAEAYAATVTPASFTVNIPGGFNNFGQLSHLSTDFSKPANLQLATYWWGGGAYASVADVSDETKSARVSLHRDWADRLINSIDLGGVYAERTKTLVFVGTNYNLANGADCIYGACASVPTADVLGNSPMGYTGIGTVFHFDVIRALADKTIYTASPNDPKSPAWNWGVEEKIFTGFAKLGIAGDFIIPWKGNLGVQVVSVKQSASGIYDDQSGNLQPSGGGLKYTDVLPSLVLSGDIDSKTKLRLGVSRAVSRPAMEDMRASTTASVSVQDRQWYGSGGNPQLKPWLSTDFDISIERYFARGSYVSLALFDKAISRGILTKTVAYDFSGFTNPSGIVPVSSIGSMVTPTNVKGGYVRGVELTLALDGKVLSSALSGFGLQTNYAYSESSLPGTFADGTPDPNAQLEGLSNHVANATFYYEKDGVQFRIGERYRSGFSASRHNAFRFVKDTIRPELITDVQAGYTIQHGMLKGLGLLFEVNNVFDRPYVVTQTVESQTVLKEFHKFGRQYLLGLSYQY